MSANSPSPPQSAVLDDSRSYVMGEVRRHDRDRFLTALFAPADHRQDLWALYAFNIEVARIPESVSEPLLGRIKVQWWRDMLGAVAEGRSPPAGHPIAEALASAMVDRRFTSQWLDDLLVARETEFSGEGFADMAAMEAHADLTAVRLAWLSLEVMGISDDVSRDAARHAARAYALTGLVRAIPFHVAHNRLQLPQDLIVSAGVTLGGLQAGEDREALCKVTTEVAARARHHISLAKALSRMADRRAMPILLWATMAEMAGRALEKAGHDVLHPHVMGYRASVLPLMWRSWRGRL